MKIFNFVKLIQYIKNRLIKVQINKSILFIGILSIFLVTFISIFFIYDLQFTLINIVNAILILLGGSCYYTLLLIIFKIK